MAYQIANQICKEFVKYLELTLARIAGSASTTAVKHFIALVLTAIAVSHNTFNI